MIVVTHQSPQCIFRLQQAGLSSGSSSFLQLWQHMPFPYPYCSSVGSEKPFPLLLTRILTSWELSKHLGGVAHKPAHTFFFLLHLISPSGWDEKPHEGAVHLFPSYCTQHTTHSTTFVEMSFLMLGRRSVLDGGLCCFIRPVSRSISGQPTWNAITVNLSHKTQTNHATHFFFFNILKFHSCTRRRSDHLTISSDRFQLWCCLSSCSFKVTAGFGVLVF